MASSLQPTSPICPRRLLLVDHHPLLRRGLRHLLETEPDLIVCAEAATPEAGLAAIAAHLPDLVITELSFRGGDGLEMVKDITKRFPMIPVLVLSMREEVIYAERALRAGARGYVAKHELNDEVIQAVRRVLAGELHTSSALSRQFAGRYLASPVTIAKTGVGLLSDRELEVFQMIGSGQATGKIARALGLSVKTIESHRVNLKLKLQLPSGSALARTALLWVETGRLS